MSQHLPTVTVRDGRLEAFLLCMWAVMLMATLGGELRLLIRSGGHFWAVLLVIAFYVACFLTRAWLVDRTVFKPSVKRGEKTIPVKLSPALREVDAYVQARAAQLGITDNIHVYYIPGTWRSVDAYVFGATSHQIVVISGGLHALFTSSRAEDLERFRFVIDHELGHIAGRDTNLLYLARATLWVGAVALAVKILFIMVLGPELALRPYIEMFPSAVRPSLWNELALFPKNPNEAFVIGFFALFTGFCLGLSAYFYVLIARRREELADRYAVAHSQDRQRAVETMRHLLSGEPLSTLPPHAFLGSLRWHPPAQARLDSVVAASVAAIPEIIGNVMVVLTLLTIRFMLGDIANDRGSEGYDRTGLIVASAAYMLLIGAVLGLMSRDGVVRGRRAQCMHIARTSMSLIGWTFLVSAALACVAYLFVSPPADSRNAMEGGQFIADIETTERTLLIMSAPIVVAAFAVASMILSVWRMPSDTFAWRTIVNLGRSAIALSILFFAGAMMNGTVVAYRYAKYDAYWNARMLALQTGKRSYERDFEALPAEIKKLMPLAPDKDDFDPFRREDIRSALRFLPGESQVFAMRVGIAFSPPFSFVALWQAPIRSTLL